MDNSADMEEIFSHGEMTFYAVRVDKFGRWLTLILRTSRIVEKCVVFRMKIGWHMDCSSIGVPVGISSQQTGIGKHHEH